MNKKNLLHHLGTIIMAFSFILFLIVYYPVIKFIIFTSVEKTIIPQKNSHIEIPKIRVSANIIENVDPWKKDEYIKALNKGIAHAKNTALPGEKGTVFLFAHSSDSPWSITRYNVPFLFLDNLEKNDEILIFRNRKKYKYKVREKKIVWPNETKYLKETEKTQLILQTCFPIGTTFQRLLVFADPS